MCSRSSSSIVVVVFIQSSERGHETKQHNGTNNAHTVTMKQYEQTKYINNGELKK